MSLPSGSRFGPYVVQHRLGQGGMGEVYLAHDTRLRRDVALKVLPPTSAADASARRRLLDEARLGARLEHPNIAAIYEVGSLDGRDYIAMQRIPGATLELSLPSHPLPEREALALASQIADAVAHAHAHGVIHRDLKPENVMLTPDGRAIVLDFGIARATESPKDGDTAGPTLTAPGAVAGTPSAMSPEQARGEALDARTDVFSFGVLLYRMLAGREPFQGASAAETVAALLLREATPLAEVAPGTSPELQRIVHKCLEKDRDLRYGAMREVTIDLERLRRGTTAIAGAPSLPGARKRIGRRTLAIAAVLGALAIALVILFARDSFRAAPAIRTLAVLPFRSLSTDADTSYLGLGVADAVISRVSQDPGLVVRPTSAVRRYVTADADAAKAADELRVDAVLEGTWQRVGDRLRVTANLLRSSDGASLWSERFDARSEDLFDVQDQISNELAARLRTRLAAPPAAKTRGGTRNPAAYEIYAQGLFYFSERGFGPKERHNSDAATRLFEEAVKLDPAFALAHAHLASAYLWTALFIEQAPQLVEKASAELAAAERIDPGLGMIPFVRSQILYSAYSGWRIDESIHEFKKAQRLGYGMDGETEIAALHFHLGLEDGWRALSERAIAQNPANRRNREVYVNEAYLLSRPELGRKLQKDLLGEEPDVRYWSILPDTARTIGDLERSALEEPDRPLAQVDLAWARVLQGRNAEADSLIRLWAPRLPRDRAYHHWTFEIAQIYAIMGNAPEAVRWLDETVAWGFPCLPLFERDRFLDPIRKSPEFVTFLDRLRPTWERYRKELEG